MFKNLRNRYKRVPNGDKKALFWFVLMPLTFLAIWIISYAMNIVKLIGMDSVLTGLGAARVLGILFPPLGGLMGWF